MNNYLINTPDYAYPIFTIKRPKLMIFFFCNIRMLSDGLILISVTIIEPSSIIVFSFICSIIYSFVYLFLLFLYSFVYLFIFIYRYAACSCTTRSSTYLYIYMYKTILASLPYKILYTAEITGCNASAIRKSICSNCTRRRAASPHRRANRWVRRYIG